jgi:hypothetical protein
MWLEPQPSAIIGGAAIAERSTTLVKAIDELVRKPSPIGAMVQSQARPSTTVPPGIMVNGGVWASINGTLIWALNAIGPWACDRPTDSRRSGNYYSVHSGRMKRYLTASSARLVSGNALATSILFGSILNCGIIANP